MQIRAILMCTHFHLYLFRSKPSRITQSKDKRTGQAGT